MDAKTLEALKGSIKKWQDIVDGVGEDDGPANCPLCQLFLDSDAGTWCRDCPVGKVAGGHDNCSSQYDAWHDHLLEEHAGNEHRIHCPDCKTFAKQELEFLKSLLPEGEL